MLLLRTVCTTDWKGRPGHDVRLVAQGDDQEALLEAMDRDVAEWQATDIAADEWCELENQGIEPEAGSDTAREQELLATKTPTEILEMWKIERQRWEMETPDQPKREFVQQAGEPGEWTTTVYHLLNDDFSYRS